MSSSSLSLSSLLHSLPASPEMLSFYRKRVMGVEQTEREWLTKLDSLVLQLTSHVDLESKVASKTKEVDLLKTALADVMDALNQERSRNVTLQAHKERLEMRCRQLLESQSSGSSRKGEEFPASFQLEMKSLEDQIVQQEQCHQEAVACLEDEKRRATDALTNLHEKQEEKLHVLTQKVAQFETTTRSLLDTVLQSQSKLRKQEREWLGERDVLHRKIQLLQHYNLSAPPIDVDKGGVFCEERAKNRLDGQKQMRNRMQHLSAELSEYKSSCERYRKQLLSLESELALQRKQLSKANANFKKKAENMVEQTSLLQSRYEELDRKRKSEAEGYRADVNLMQRKIKQVEQQLLSAAIAKNKEHEYIRTIKSQDNELERLQNILKKHPVWQS